MTWILWSPSAFTTPPGAQVFDEKVVRHHETFLVVRQTQIVRSRAGAEVHDAQELRMVRTRDVEHHDLAGAVERDEQARALAC